MDRQIYRQMNQINRQIDRQTVLKVNYVSSTSVCTLCVLWRQMQTSIEKREGERGKEKVSRVEQMIERKRPHTNANHRQTGKKNYTTSSSSLSSSLSACAYFMTSNALGIKDRTWTENHKGQVRSFSDRRMCLPACVVVL